MIRSHQGVFIDYRSLLGVDLWWTPILKGAQFHWRYIVIFSALSRVWNNRWLNIVFEILCFSLLMVFSLITDFIWAWTSGDFLYCQVQKIGMIMFLCALLRLWNVVHRYLSQPIGELWPWHIREHWELTRCHVNTVKNFHQEWCAYAEFHTTRAPLVSFIYHFNASLEILSIL